MHYKKDFRDLLESLNLDIIECLLRDNEDKAELTGFIVPRFYRIVSRFWCKPLKSYLRK